MSELIGVKTYTGMNFVRADRVVAVQPAPTGGALITLVDGVIVTTIESTTAVSGRIKNSEIRAAMATARR